ncbi:MAG TPA: DinB family protein [Candidatus Limnocylindrales bacterium]|nr:DinB family protein [Candidatus Limnocylindrales bacterium]
MTSPAEPAAPSGPPALGADPGHALSAFVGAVDDFDRHLRALDDPALDAPWAWEAYDEEGVRFGILRTTEQVADAAVEIAAGRAAAGAGPTRAERLLGRYLVAWRELWSVADRVDAAIDTPPADGEWPLRTILDHLVEAEIGFLATIRNGLDQRRAGVATPVRIASDDAWLALGEVDEPAWRAAFEGSLSDMRAFHLEVRDRVLSRLGSMTEAEMDWESPFWDGERSNRFRVGRFESHLRQHTIQAEKAVQAVVGAPREVERLLRLLARATGDVEAAAVGAEPELVAPPLAALTGEIAARMEELTAAVATRHD